MQSPDSVLTSETQFQQAPPYSKLLPELLLALLGHTGDVFVEKALFIPERSSQQPPPERCNFAVTDAPGLVSTSERYNSPRLFLHPCAERLAEPCSKL